MRGFLIGIAALLALAVPSLASADTGGYVKILYASINTDDDFFDDEYEGYGFESDNVVALSGAVVTDVNDRWRVQFDGASSDTDSNYGSYGYSNAHSQVEVHATYETGMFDVGVFTGMFNNNGHNFYEYGVEGTANFERGEVSLSVAGATSPNSSFFDDITTIAASGTFVLNENISLNATVSQTNFGNYGFGDDAEVTSYGIGAAYNIPNTDFTVAAGYRSSQVDLGDGFYFGSDDQDVDFFGVSLAWTFGEGSRGREMPGASALIPDAIAAGSGFVI